MSAPLGPLVHRHVLTLPAEPPAVRVARETAEQALAEWGIDGHHPVVGPALLIVSELVANSVRHAAPTSGPVTVTYAAGADRVAFAVHDGDPRRPDLHAPGTGGLATVMELTTCLGGTAVVRGDGEGGGKSIWITLPLR